MIFKLIGSLLIIGSCSSFGFSISRYHHQEEALLAELGRIIDQMLWELPFQLAPLPELVNHASTDTANKILARTMRTFSGHLERQILPDVHSCMEAAIADVGLDFFHARKILSLLGLSLGRFDLSGQINSLSAVREQCRREQEQLQLERTSRIRSYRVLSLCSGIALAILLI